MSKNRQRQPATSDRPGQPSGARGVSSRREVRFPVFVRLLISAIIIWHVTAVFLAPLSIPPSSELAVETAQSWWMQWYLDMLYLNHGYHFFAPDPGAGHVIRYEVFDQAGNVTAQGEFPNRDTYWPRLRYHRYFMLADQSELGIPNEEVRDQWLREYLETYARQILREHDGESVRVQRLIHYQAYPDEVLEGKALDDPSFYKVQMEVVQTRADVEASDAAFQRASESDQHAEGWEGVTP